jgi:hypothetical protein
MKSRLNTVRDEQRDMERRQVEEEVQKHQFPHTGQRE